MFDCRNDKSSGNKVRRALPAAFLGVLLTAAAAAGPSGVVAQGGGINSLGVVYADGRQTEDIPLRKVEESSSELYISAYDLARIFKATKYWKPGQRKLVLRIKNRRYLFTLDTRVVTVDEQPVLLRVPVRYSEGSVMIPVEFIQQILAREDPGRVDFDSRRLVLTIGAPRYNVTSIEFEDTGKGTRAILTMKEELLYHVDNETPGLLRLKIYGGRLNTLKFSATEGRGLFKRVRAEQTEYDAYLFFQVEKSASRFKVEFLGPEPEGEARRLAIYLEEGDLPEIPEADYAGRKIVEMMRSASPGYGGFEIKKVVIDPGHGGSDSGRISEGGIAEKDVNLELSGMLKDMMVERLGVEVFLTRRTDRLIPLHQRGEIANVKEADLFISVHCNGWFHPDAGGFETFFLAPARNEEESRQAKEENSSIKFENPGLDPESMEELDFILWDMVQNEFINESSELAEIIQKKLDRVLDIRNRGVRQAGLRVLKGLKMPGVLVEVAFLSNPAEERLLRSEKFRRRVCEGIVEAVREFSSTGVVEEAER